MQQERVAAFLPAHRSQIHPRKKEEHNYSLFVSDNLGEQPTKCSPEEDEEDEEDVDDEDHDEGFGSEHELSENEEEEEEEEDYEDDKDDDISDTFSEPGIALFGGLPNCVLLS